MIEEKIVKKPDGNYYKVTTAPVDAGFDIDREIGATQEQIDALTAKLKALIKAKEGN